MHSYLGHLQHSVIACHAQFGFFTLLCCFVLRQLQLSSRRNPNEQKKKKKALFLRSGYFQTPIACANRTHLPLICLLTERTVTVLTIWTVKVVAYVVPVPLVVSQACVLAPGKPIKWSNASSCWIYQLKRGRTTLARIMWFSRLFFILTKSRLTYNIIWIAEALVWSCHTRNIHTPGQSVQRGSRFLTQLVVFPKHKPALGC